MRMMRSEQVAEFTGAAHVLRPAAVAHPVSALDVIPAVSQIAVARIALTSPEMLKIETQKRFFIFKSSLSRMDSVPQRLVYLIHN